jgi:hypothetical protein
MQDSVLPSGAPFFIDPVLEPMKLHSCRQAAGFGAGFFS